MEVTETAYLYATVLPNDATYNSVSFSSSNESIATIDRSGKITPIKVGTIIITATLDNGARGTLEADCTLEILPETIFATDFSINPANPTVEYQGTVQLQAIITPSNASFQHVTWKCDNTTIATVDSNGLVTAHSAGQATITATLTNGTKPNIVKTTTITVNENSSGDGDGISDNGELDEVGTN